MSWISFGLGMIVGLVLGGEFMNRYLKGKS
jgi:hypothetical protein